MWIVSCILKYRFELQSIPINITSVFFQALSLSCNIFLLLLLETSSLIHKENLPFIPAATQSGKNVSSSDFPSATETLLSWCGHSYSYGDNNSEILSTGGRDQTVRLI